MAQYFIIHSTTREVVRTSSSPFNIDENVQPPPPHIQLKRIDDDSQPAFDPATQKLVRVFTDDDVLFTRTFSNQVVAKTQAEIDAYNLAQTDETARQVIRAEYNNLKNGVGTTAERAARLERAVAWLLRQYVRD